MALFTDRAGLRMDMSELMVGLRVWGIDLPRETVERLRTAVLQTLPPELLGAEEVSPPPIRSCTRLVPLLAALYAPPAPVALCGS